MAKFLVQTEPGVQIPGLGFFRHGDTFQLPDDTEKPVSRFLVPLDDAAWKLLKRSKVAYVERLEKQYADAGQKFSEGQKRALLEMPEVYGKPIPGPEVKEEQPTIREVAEGKSATVPAPHSKRAADR